MRVPHSNKTTTQRSFLPHPNKDSLQTPRWIVAFATTAGSTRLSAKGLRLTELQQLFESCGVNAAEYSAQTVYKKMYKEWITDEDIDSLRYQDPKISQGAANVLKVNDLCCMLPDLPLVAHYQLGTLVSPRSRCDAGSCDIGWAPSVA